jgi:hypothetical protein
VTKLRLRAETSQYYPVPTSSSTVGGGSGGGGAFSADPKICLIKTWIPLIYNHKLIENDFFGKHLKKRFAEIYSVLWGLFDFNKIFCNAIRIYFHFKDLLVHKQWGLGLNKHYFFRCIVTVSAVFRKKLYYYNVFHDNLLIRMSIAW